MKSRATIDIAVWSRDYKLKNDTKSNCTGAGFTNDLQETLTYGGLLKHVFCLILRTFGWLSFSNNFIKCLYNRARCILIHNFLELGKICVSKVHRKLRFPASRSQIRCHDSNTKYPPYSLMVRIKSIWYRRKIAEVPVFTVCLCMQCSGIINTTFGKILCYNEINRTINGVQVNLLMCDILIHRNPHVQTVFLILIHNLWELT